MQKLNLSVKALNHYPTTHLEENNWPVSEDTLEKSRFNNDYCGPENGFRLLVGNRQITIWNGVKRIYIPLVGFNLTKQRTQRYIKEVLSRDGLFDRMTEYLACLKINKEQVLELLWRYLIDLNYKDNNLYLYMQGDFNKQLVLTNLSMSNYIYGHPYGAENKKGKICYDVIEVDHVDDETVQQMLKQMTQSSEELFKMNYQKSMIDRYINDDLESVND